MTSNKTADKFLAELGDKARAYDRLKESHDSLLAACEAWIGHYDAFVKDDQIGDEPGIGEIRAAIAKAKGGDA